MKCLYRASWCMVICISVSLCGCAAPYQLTYEKDLPVLHGGLADVLFHNRNSHREEVINSALESFSLHIEDKGLLDCVESTAPPKGAKANSQQKKIDPPQSNACVPLEEGTNFKPVPRSVAAIISASVGECVYEVYQQDTTAVSQETLGTFLGIGLLAGGIANSIVHGPSAISTATSVSGAGVTAASNLQKNTPQNVTVMTKNVIEAGLAYYPLLHARVNALTPVSKPDRYKLLSAMWDATGSGCPGGVLKGRSFFNKWAEKEDETSSH